jgi:hypothetical protein
MLNLTSEINEDRDLKLFLLMSIVWKNEDWRINEDCGFWKKCGFREFNSRNYKGVGFREFSLALLNICNKLYTHKPQLSY